MVFPEFPANSGMTGSAKRATTVHSSTIRSPYPALDSISFNPAVSILPRMHAFEGVFGQSAAFFANVWGKAIRVFGKYASLQSKAIKELQSIAFGSEQKMRLVAW